MSETPVTNDDYSLIHSLDQSCPVDATGIISPSEDYVQNNENKSGVFRSITQWPPPEIQINPSLPKTTIATKTSSNSLDYIHRCAEVSAQATLLDPLCIVFEIEKSPGKFPDVTNIHTNNDYVADRYIACRTRLQTKLNTNSIIIEAGDFAAAACWTQASEATPPELPASMLDKIAEDGRPVFADFLRQVEVVREKHLYPVSRRYWHLSLMARDPRREYVPGAVRAVVEPFLQLAKKEGVPVWLEAGSPRARDIYAHFGLVVVGTVTAMDVTTWCMITQ